jgi:hypothetical protein
MGRMLYLSPIIGCGSDEQWINEIADIPLSVKVRTAGKYITGDKA